MRGSADGPEWAIVALMEESGTGPPPFAQHFGTYFSSVMANKLFDVLSSIAIVAILC